MAEGDESTFLRALAARDETAFRQLAERYRRELLVHCYRMLGSLEDAEDVLQETLLRAWRGLGSFEGRSGLRPWLYKIATNVCLSALAIRRRRGLPHLTLGPGDPDDALPGPADEPVWLEPVPDAVLDLRPGANPQVHYDARESVTLAFLAAIQRLPGRQRAVLILGDVLGFSAAEIADLLSTSTAAVNSAMQRARARMKDYRSPPASSEADTDQMAVLLARYVDAWQAADAQALVALLREDAIFTMPPLPLWFHGRAAAQGFLEKQLFAGAAQGRFRLVPTAANGSPAFATYQRDESGVYRSGALQVLTIEHNQITEIHDFLAFDDRLFNRFGLPLSLV
jgi:RNA polymerase sigma-70 factor (ECF subfamily)